MTSTAGLSREVLKWLQSLDLSYSVKNVKRDFSNGFLVAEIFSRYYPADIHMHSFDNGIGLEKKMDNWELLEKFFKKREIPITREMFDPVVHVKEGAAVTLVEAIYAFLTKKTVVKKPDNGDGQNAAAGESALPGYARPTASKLVKDSVANTELVAQPDMAFSASKAAASIQQHTQAVKEDKKADPARYAPPIHKNTSPTKSVPHTVTQSAATSSVQFREVNVKPLERSIAQVRAARTGQIGTPGAGEGN